jgi:hypothetical protein
MMETKMAEVLTPKSARWDEFVDGMSRMMDALALHLCARVGGHERDETNHRMEARWPPF